MNSDRKDHEPPMAIAGWGWRYHHTGIPTNDPIENGKYIAAFRMTVGGFDKSPFGIEWMKFDEGSPVDDLVKKVPHVAFEVDDLAAELRKHDFKVITRINSPGEGVRVAMIEHNGAPVELIEFAKK